MQNTNLASTMSNGQSFKDIVVSITHIITLAFPVIMGIGLVYFLYGVLKYMAPGGAEKRAEEGKNIMIYGIIGLFVMASVWGLVSIVTNTFFGTPQDNINYNPNAGLFQR